MLSKRHYTDNPDVDVVSEIMRAAHCNQEEWEWFCKVYPTEAARGNIILTAYQYFPYWKQSIREGKIEDNLTLKGILEKGYEG
ncbi:1059_t:CDS:2 [Entrophospora sp. SA101]|nr:1059_t:CDS:2 [Entrophospora sp. SA101]